MTSTSGDDTSVRATSCPISVTRLDDAARQALHLRQRAQDLGGDEGGLGGGATTPCSPRRAQASARADEQDSRRVPRDDEAGDARRFFSRVE